MRNKDLYREKKKSVLTHYGGSKCACIRCGFDDIRALSIDHIAGDGYKQRGSNTYGWLIKNHFPKGFQTLCMNCQFIKRFENKENYISKERLKQRAKDKLNRLKKEFGEVSYIATAKQIRKHIKNMNHLTFRTMDIQLYFGIESPSLALNRLYVLLHRMVGTGQLHRLGNGVYERVVDGVNK